MNNQLFEDYLKNQLADHVEPVDPGGWDTLLTDLACRSTSRMRIRRFYYGCATVAAVFLLVILLTPPAPAPKNVFKPLSITVIHPQINTPLQRAEQIQPILRRTVRIPENSDPVVVMPDTVKTAIETHPSTPSDTLVPQTPPNRPLYNLADFDADPQPAKTRISATEGWSITLASSSANAVGEAPFATVVQRQPNNVRDLFFVRSNSDIPTKYKRESSVLFAPPVSAGINVQKELFPWMSVRLGLNYSLLYNKSSNPYLNISYSTSQHLHYVGLPTSVLFSFVRQPRLHIYASAGGCVEKAISAYYISSSGKNERVQVSGLQWSAGAGLGIEYTLSKRFGLYFEPGSAYYFDNEQPLSIRTVQPLQLKIELGLRARI